MMFCDELFIKSQCIICQDEIRGLGIQCVECPKTVTVRLCLMCFQDGGEQGPHKADHGFTYFDSGSIRIFPRPARKDVIKAKAPWSAREDIRLLDAIEQYGYGNWHDISRHIETKDATEAKQEFVEKFVFGTIGKLTWHTEDFQDITRGIGDQVCMDSRQQLNITDHTCPDSMPLSPSLSQKLPPVDIGIDEILQLGYMPNRDDYEKEYDNEAEKLLSQISFSADDEEWEAALKLSLIDMYSQRLRERFRRKKVIKEYQLVSQFFKKDRLKSQVTWDCSTSGKSNAKKRFAPYERYLQEKLHPFAQFRVGKEQDHLIAQLVKEKELVLRLQELYKYRSNGITRHDECTEYEKFVSVSSNFKAKRSLDATLDTAMEDDDVASNDDDTSKAKNSNRSMEKNFPVMIQQLQQKIETQSAETATSLSLSDLKKEGSEGVLSVKKATPQLSSKEDCNSSNYTESEGSEPVSSLQEKVALNPVTLQTSALSQPIEEQKDSVGLSTADLLIPGQDLLSIEEMKLCARTNLLPVQYLTVKAALVANNPSLQLLQNSSEEDKELKADCPECFDSREWEEIMSYMKSAKVL